MDLGLGILLPLLGNILGSISANKQANQANALGQQQVALQKRMVDYLLNKREKVYDPILEGVALPRLQSRATTPPPYYQDAMNQVQQLRKPMNVGW